MMPGVEPGTLIGGTYRIVRRIGSGGMGEVYEATHERLAHRYAVKFLHPGVREHPEAMPRFMREAQVTSRLRHPGIVSVVDFNLLPGGAPYLVMEYLEGESLAAVLGRTGPLPLSRVVDIVDQLSAALTAAHLEGVVHRDMHPQNVFVVPGAGGQSDRIKVLDFGISKIASISQRITGLAAVMGTPQYMSPEQAEGKTDELDAASDQFSLAAIVYEMLTGRKAFAGETLASVAYQIVHARPLPIQTYRPELPAEIENVVTRALAKDKKDRFPSVSEFAVHLRWTATLPARDIGARPDADDAAPTLVSDREETTAVSALPSGMAAVLRESTPELASSAGRDTGETAVGRPAREMEVGRTGRDATDDEQTVVAGQSTFAALATLATKPATATTQRPARSADPELTVMHEATLFGMPGRRRGAVAAASIGGALVIAAVVVGAVSRTRGRSVEHAGAPMPPAVAPSPPPVAPMPPSGAAVAPSGPPVVAMDTLDPPTPAPTAEPVGARRSPARARPHAGAAGKPAAESGGDKPEANLAGVAGATGPCQLTVGTYPWSELWIDGADTGQHTPVVALPIACGAHRLEFKRRDLRIDQVERVSLNEGHEFRRQYELRGAEVDD
jgi:serine/threonine protein kinase